jgi:L-ascorbate metabolism protein UlaG (beta-lactamase superfamily)
VNAAPDFRRASNWARLRSYLWGLPARVNGYWSVAPLPRALPDVARLHDARRGATVTWVGHSTLLVQLDGVSFLTDPTWSDRVGPFSGSIGVSRYTPPGVPLDRLPPIAFVLVSHDHYDHLDEPTVRRLARTFDPRFVVPRGVKAWLAARGIANAVELDWGESTSIRGLEIVCTPAQHGSGRTLTDTGKRLWASWAVIGSRRFYFAGDTGYARHFALIGDELGPFDLAALPIGSYTPPAMMRPVHLSPEEALQAWRDLRARRFVGIHWGTFRLAREAYDEPPRRIAAEVERLRLDPRAILVPWPGQTFDW